MSKFVKIAVAFLLTAILAYAVFLHSSTIRQNVAMRDSIAYWSAGWLLVHSQNPYDHETVLSLERDHGYKDQRPLVLRTPPWSLLMVAGLGLVTPFCAWVIWITLSLACFFFGLSLCVRMYGGNSVPRNLFALVGYTFAPVPACLVSGQMGLVLMLGIVLFLWLERERPFLSGAVLIIPLAKPHLLSLFWLIFVIWVARERKGTVALGFVSALVFATGTALTFDPNVFQHYREMLNTAAVGREFIPALSGVLRLLFFRNRFWLQFAPMLAGLLWSLWFYFQNAANWDWRQHGPALLIVSVLVTPYEWLSDETVLLPAVLQAAAFVYSLRGVLKLSAKVGIVIFALLNVLLLLILKAKVPFSTGIYFWSSLVWFFWYFRARNWYLRAPASGFNVEPAVQVT